MVEPYGACGLDCGACLGYLAAQTDSDLDQASLVSQACQASGLPGCSNSDVLCDGCLSGGRLSRCARECDLRRCCVSRGLDSCAACSDFACGRLAAFLLPMPVVRIHLEELHAFFLE